MRQGLAGRSLIGRSVSALAVIGMVLTGCSIAVVGNASPGADQPRDVASGQLTITGAGEDPVDRQVRDALVDITAFWQEQFPKAYGKPFAPLQGGYFSVASRNLDQGGYPAPRL